jgi:UDP-glucose 4-epimerase
MPLTIFGDGEQTRDFVYVKDIVAANLAAIRRGDGQIVQVGTASSTSVNHLANMLSIMRINSFATLNDAIRIDP